jgi:hypothetical protein
MGLLEMSPADWTARGGGLSRLKLKMDGATAEEIAAEIKRQTGVEAEADPHLKAREGQEAPRFSVAADGPFWPAVMAWAKDGLHLRRDYARRDLLRLSRSGQTHAGRSQTFGPCTLTASFISVHRSRSISLQPGAKPSASSSLSISASLLVDPRFRPQIAAQFAEVSSAVDDRGRAIAHGEPDHMYGDHGDAIHVGINLAVPHEDATKIKSLKGTLHLAVATRREKWEVDLDATPTGEKVFESEAGEITVKFLGLSERGAAWVAKFSTSIKPSAPRRIFKAQGHRGNPLQPGTAAELQRSIQFQNSERKPLGMGGSSSRSEGFDGADRTRRISTLELTLAAPPNDPDLEKHQPAHLVIDLPIEWREVKIPFELKDLPLP